MIGPLLVVGLFGIIVFSFGLMLATSGARNILDVEFEADDSSSTDSGGQRREVRTDGGQPEEVDPSQESISWPSASPDVTFTDYANVDDDEEARTDAEADRTPKNRKRTRRRRTEGNDEMPTTVADVAELDDRIERDGSISTLRDITGKTASSEADQPAVQPSESTQGIPADTQSGDTVSTGTDIAADLENLGSFSTPESEDESPTGEESVPSPTEATAAESASDGEPPSETEVDDGGSFYRKTADLLSELETGEPTTPLDPAQEPAEVPPSHRIGPLRPEGTDFEPVSPDEDTTAKGSDGPRELDITGIIGVGNPGVDPAAELPEPATPFEILGGGSSGRTAAESELDAISHETAVSATGEQRSRKHDHTARRVIDIEATLVRSKPAVPSLPKPTLPRVRMTAESPTHFFSNLILVLLGLAFMAAGGYLVVLSLTRVLALLV